MTSTEQHKYSVGDIVEARVEKIVPGGHGLAFAEELTLFVDLAVPGDRLHVNLREIKGKIAFAEIQSIIEPAAERIDPPCPYVGVCGGCNFQQMDYEAQLAAKVEIARDCLRRIGKFDYENEIPIISSPAGFGYRLRAQWHINRDLQKVGYYRRDSRDLISIEHCPILAPELDDALQRVRGEIDWNSFWPDKGAIDAAVGSDGSVSLHSEQLDLGNDEISVDTAGESYRFSAKVFFQGNKFLIDKLVETAIGDASGAAALDLYSGVGLFTLPLARRFQRVSAVEEYGPAVEYAKKNAVEFANVEIIERPVGRFVAEHKVGDVIDFVLLDPPRSGTEKKTVLDLIRLRPRHVSYVSCDPSVLARDLRRFLDGGYRIASITAVDLFPQTHHVETVVHLDL
jgi:23S rRNA (uracil1939-C5)-methyltransferase